VLDKPDSQPGGPAQRSQLQQEVRQTLSAWATVMSSHLSRGCNTYSQCGFGPGWNAGILRTLLQRPYRMSLHVPVSLISFTSVLYCSVFESSFTSVVGFIPKYFILFHASVNGTEFPISSLAS
jgi:hypothetical protein